MNILEYTDSLPDIMKQEDILEIIRIYKTRLMDTVIPLYQEAVKINPKIDDTNLVEIFKRNIISIYDNKITYTGDILTTINKINPIVYNNSNDLLAYIMGNLSPTFPVKGLDNKKVIAIQLTEFLFFYVEYAIGLLDHLTSTKLNVTDILPVVEKELVKGMPIFVTVATILSRPKLIDVLEGLHDVVINNDNITAIKSVYSAKEVDPYSGYIAMNFKGNPIYVIRQLLLNRKVKKFEYLKERKALLEAKILYLKSLKTSSPNPKTEEKINKMQESVNNYEYKIHKLEEWFDG